MKSIKAREHDDAPVTQAVLARAVDLARKRGSASIRAQGVCYLPKFKALAVRFANQAAILLPVKKYPELAQLSVAELGRVKLGFGGSALCLEERNMHLDIAALVASSQSLMKLAATLIAARNGRRSSIAKVLAARENGRKGGWPRKLTETS